MIVYGCHKTKALLIISLENMTDFVYIEKDSIAIQKVLI